MNNVQEMVMRQRGGIVVWAAIAACALLQACAQKHSPQDSTETGNPPVIDAERVALKADGDDVHIVGSKGAVMPGSVTIHVTNLVSDKSASGRAAMNGSFDVKAPGGANDTFMVQATVGDAKSKPIYALPWGVFAGEGADGTLSCDQQTQFGQAQIGRTERVADTSCTSDDDCVIASNVTICSDACDGALVSKSGKAEIDAAISAIENGVCGSFKADGCKLIAIGCVPPNHSFQFSCVSGRCTYDDFAAGTDAGAIDAGPLTCEQRLDQADAMLVQAENDADRTCTSDNDCVVGPAATECSDGCAGAIVSTKGRMQVQDAIASINAGVCAGYRDDGCPLPNVDCGGAGTPVCKQGRCQAALTCDQRSTAASEELRNATALADNTCSTNADCVFAPVGVDCFAGCSSPAISIAGEAQLQADIAAINAGVCAGFTDDGCSVVLPPCPAPPDPASCNQGRCAPGPSCDDRVAAAEARLNQVAAAADKACTQDADCDYPTSGVQCSLGCAGFAILSAQGRSQYDAAVAELNAGVCKNFLVDGCPMSGATCPGPPTPICKQGQCAGAPAP